MQSLDSFGFGFLFTLPIKSAIHQIQFKCQPQSPKPSYQSNYERFSSPKPPQEPPWWVIDAKSHRQRQAPAEQILTYLGL